MATCRAGLGLTVGSTSVSCLPATPGDVVLEVDRSVEVPVDDQAAGAAGEGAGGQGQFGFHRLAGAGGGTQSAQVGRQVAGGEGVITALAEGEALVSRLTSDRVWRELAKASFAVISYVTPTGTPRSSGVVYTTVGRRMYVAVADDSWKARHITASGQVAVTVPVRRGGIMSLLVPIPPATISFHASAIVHPASSLEGSSLLKELASLLPPERRTACRIIEIQPVGQFLTYGVGVSLMQMRSPALARGRVPVD